MAEAFSKLVSELKSIPQQFNIINADNELSQVANEYYHQNQGKCDRVIRSGENLATQTAPINAESIKYQFQPQRTRRLAEDFNDLISSNTLNYEVSSGSLSQNVQNPSIIKVVLKFDILLTLDFNKSEKSMQSMSDNPCIDCHSIVVFDSVWYPSLTLNDVVHFCNTIVQGDNPTDLLKRYVSIYYDNTMQSLSKNNKMKDYLLRYTNPVCKCGAEMEQIVTDECYGNQYSYVICDGCDIKCNKTSGITKEIVYHCPNKQLQNIHPHGYDVCFDCVYKNHLRLRQFNALIIAPPMTSGNIVCTDPERLTTLFQDLGYHQIITLKGNQASKKEIKNSIDKIYGNNDKNINKVCIICYTGHGIYRNTQFYFEIYDGVLSDNELKAWIYGYEHNADIDIKDGYNQCKNALDIAVNKQKSTFLRQNTLILINACHSGGFKALNQVFFFFEHSVLRTK